MKTTIPAAIPTGPNNSVFENHHGVDADKMADPL